MKQMLLPFLLIVTFLFTTHSVSAGGIIIYGKGPKFELKEKLPDDFLQDGQHLNFGIAYEQFSIFWIPVWNYGDTQYVLVTDDLKMAYELNGEDQYYLSEEFDLDTSSVPKISFWNKTGGKLVWGMCILLLLVLIWSLQHKEEELAVPFRIEDEEEQPVEQPVIIPLRQTRGRRRAGQRVAGARRIKKGIGGKRRLGRGIKKRR
jgi:hypothetical protein